MNYQSINEALAATVRELSEATAKYPQWPTCPFRALAIVVEELGETARNLNKLVADPTDPEHARRLRENAVQTCATAMRFLVSLQAEAYDMAATPTHGQAADDL